MKKLLTTFWVLIFTINFAQTYDNSIPKFEEVAGYKTSDKPAGYFDVVNYIKAVANTSSKVKLVQEGQTYQGRKLYYLIVTSDKNHNRLDQIKQNLELIADPRKAKDKNIKKIIEETPAVAFMMYSIHGNEASGTNASLKLLYELTANNSPEINELLDKLIVIIYPMENPDGRQRFISQAEQWYGRIKDPDTQSFPHSGLWPSGRTNHYHFDLNRDWFILSQPESKARVKAVLDWHPQLVVDAHEMGSFSTFLFNPPREPINPHMHKIIQDWWHIFSKDQAKAFDEHGWSYYTREWLEEWYPGYGTSWPSYAGAVAILYEQARTAGTDVKRPDGTTLTYGQSVEHQFVSSLANLKTAAERREELLNDFYKMKAEAVENNSDTKAFIIEPDENTTRINRFIERLNFQKIEMFIAKNDFSVNAKDPWGTEKNSFPKGSIIIPLNQPLSPLVKAICEFDTRMTNKYLKSERESIMKGKGTRLYEVSAWSMPLGYGLKIYSSNEYPDTEMEEVHQINKDGETNLAEAKYGYLIKLTDENVYPLLYKLMTNGIQVNVADEPFEVESKKFERGTLLIRKIENPNLNINVLSELSSEYKIKIYPVNTALATTGTDLGGGNFTLLTEPRTAFLVGNRVSMGDFGAIWYLLDRELGVRTSKLKIENLGRFDLSKYNVIILPPYYGSLKNDIGNGLNKLKEWVKDGGTLISFGRGAAALADSSVKFSRVRLRSQILSKLDSYLKSVKEDKEKLNFTIDSLEIWEAKDFNIPTNKSTKTELNSTIKFESLARKFSPQGVYLTVDLNPEHWLAYGSPNRIAAFYSSSNVFMNKSSVETVGRFAGMKDLRLSGLLWPEAAKRIENSSYLTRERYGRGQIILFAAHPDFRAYNYGTARLLLNAIFLGPGHGTARKVKW